MVSVALAGGGTAGHTSPLIATAKAIQASTTAEIECIGTQKGLETRVIPDAGLSLSLIDPVPMPRKPGIDLLKLPVRLTRSVGQARKILKRTKADVLVGFGGYVSIPAYLAAASMRIPIVVHEANKLPGLANKVGARFAAFVGTTFRETQLRGSKLIGMPMTRSITAPALDRASARREFGLSPERATLLVSGGSQGAMSINQALIGCLEQVLAAGIQVLHVLGPKNFSEATHQRIDHPSGASYQPVAFVSDMAVAYAAADVMLGRAGAGTVMETAVSGLPVIFVPLPWGNGEQGRNAAELVAAKAGWLVEDTDLTPDRLAELTLDAFADASRLAEMSVKCRGMYPSDAAEVLASAVLAAAMKGN